MDKTDLVIFDTETTGLDPRTGDRIIELAAIRVRAGGKAGVFESLVDPARSVPPGASRVNGITDEMLVGAPRMGEIIPRFNEFVKGACLCAYNAPFDMGFIAAEYERSGFVFPSDIPVIDVLAMSRYLLDLERHPLWYVAQSLGVGNGQEHRALADVELTFEVFKILSARMREKAVTALDDFICLFGRGCRSFEDMQRLKAGQIQRAIELGERIRIRYFSRSDSRVTERDVVPRAIRLEGNSGYLSALCCLKNKERSFKLEGILRLETLGPEQERSKGAAA